VTIANRGTKRRCPHCGAAYYDLGRSPVVCPKCQTPYVEAQKIPIRASRARAEPPPPIDESADEATVFEEDEALDGDELDAEIGEDDKDKDDEERD
jgi:hypothetical protein